jgi:hypothetical protein
MQTHISRMENMYNENKIIIPSNNQHINQDPTPPDPHWLAITPHFCHKMTKEKHNQHIDLFP